MFYKIVSADNTNRLIQIVTDLLQQGWTPLGGIASDGQQYL